MRTGLISPSFRSFILERVAAIEILHEILRWIRTYEDDMLCPAWAQLPQSDVCLIQSNRHHRPLIL